MPESGPPATFGTTGKIGQLLDGTILERFSELDQGGKIAAEYVWIGGTMADLRSKTKTLTKEPKSPADLPLWNYDGSSTGQAPGKPLRNPYLARWTTPVGRRSGEASDAFVFHSRLLQNPGRSRSLAPTPPLPCAQQPTVQAVESRRSGGRCNHRNRGWRVAYQPKHLLRCFGFHASSMFLTVSECGSENCH